MSLAWCEGKGCGVMVDTDADPDCYYDEEKQESRDKCLCEHCREEGNA